MNLGDINSDSYRSNELGSVIDEQAGKSNADVGRQYTSGNQEARGLLKSGDNLNQSLGFNDQAMGSAIRQKYNQGYTHSESQVNNKMFQQADADHIRQLQGAADMANQEVELNRQKQILRWKKQQAERAQRGAVLGHVLGITGGVVAGIYTGGAAAGAGFAAGEAAGNMIGSAN